MKVNLQNLRRVGVLVGSALAITMVVTLIIAGCAGAPSKLERRFYEVRTNTLPTAITNSSGDVVISNEPDGYTLTPNTSADEAARGIGSVAGLFGPWAELVTAAAGGLFGLYGILRSTRARKTAAVLAQVIETGRRILEQTPQGAAAADQWRNWMMQHQAESGVINDVMELLRGAVNPESARSVAEKLIAKLPATRT